MTDDQKTNEGQQETQLGSRGITQPVVQPPVVPKQSDSKPAGQQSQEGADPAKPMFVQLVGGDDLEPFEEQTLAISRETLNISRRTYWIAIAAFGAALVAAIFVGSQVKIMSYQTQIMASQSEGANAGALMDEMNTRKQLSIVQQQADAASKQVLAAQDSVRAIQRQMRQDQRSWIIPNGDISCCVENQPVLGKGKYIVTGKTPANHILVNIAVEKVLNGKRPSFSWKIPHYQITVGTLFPNDPQTFSVPWFDAPPGSKNAKQAIMTADAIKDYKKGKFFFIVFGRIDYRDVFGVRHWSQYCWWGASTEAQGMNFTARDCTDYNSTDHD